MRGDADCPLEEEDIEKPLLRQNATNWKAPLIILGFEFLLNVVFWSISANLVMYFTKVLHESNSASATIAAAFNGTTFFMALFGAYVADSLLGCFRTAVLSSLLCVLGMVTISCSVFLQSVDRRGAGVSTVTVHSIFFYIGLCLAASGIGGIKSALLSLGAYQFDDENPVDRERKTLFFSWFYLCNVSGKLVSGVVIVWVEDNIGWVVGYGIATSCAVLGMTIFLAGGPVFKRRTPEESPLKSILQVLVAFARKMKLKVPLETAGLLHEDDGEQRLAHTDQFRCLDKAAIVEDSGSGLKGGDSWRLCTVTQVEELKMFLRMVPIFSTSVVFTAAACQTSTTVVLQGSAMNTKIGGSFSVPPAALQSVEVISTFLLTWFYNKTVITMVRRYTGNGSARGLTLLQRMGIGRFLMIIVMATAAVTEIERLKSVRMGKPVLNIAWQIPIYFMAGGAESLNYVGQIQFFYDQAPDRMKTIGAALHFLSLSMGDYLSTLVVSVVQMLTSMAGEKGWIPDDLNEGHLDCFFWFLVGLCTLNFAVHVHFSHKYTGKNAA